MSTRPFPLDLAAIEVELHSKWGWFVALGVVLLVLGILALGNLLVATLTSVFFVGIMMILGAVAQVIHAFQMKGWGDSSIGCSAASFMEQRASSPSLIRRWRLWR
jgi:uncharacterized membrane protein HdeD (DUF308 family)